jgi:cytosine/uracil/thiamine/allantoin permease
MTTTTDRFRNTMTTREGFKAFIQVEETEAMKQNKGSRLWTNKDLQPNPPETRHWNAWAFFLFQVSGLWIMYVSSIF